MVITKAEGIYKTEFIGTSRRFQESRHFFFLSGVVPHISFVHIYLLPEMFCQPMHVFCMKRDSKKRSDLTT